MNGGYASAVPAGGHPLQYGSSGGSITTPYPKPPSMLTPVNVGPPLSMPSNPEIYK